jgi:hypothetical protein
VVQDKSNGEPDEADWVLPGEEDETAMKLTKSEWLHSAGKRMERNLVLVVLMVTGFLGMVQVQLARAQAVSTTTVQGTVYLANGQPGSGTLHVSWPAFTTANGQAVVADSTTVTIAPDGFVSVNLAPNQGATPAGLYYTAVFYMSDGSVSTQYWVVPSAAQASLAQVQAQVMPAAQAVQAVNKAYVDQSISELSQSLLTASGGTLSGPLYLNGDPTQPMQAADKHYVDSALSQAIPISGGAATGPLTAVQLGAAYQVDQFPGADFGAKLQACLNAVSTAYGGTCDARNFSGTLAMGSNLTIATGNTTIELPCATITTANQVIVTAGTRNVALRGCALRGGSAASGSQGGTVFAYSGTSAMVQVGDPTYSVDTQGFHMDNVVINTTAATSATAQGLAAYRTQEMDLESLYFLGNANQTGMTLDGTGNYTGGTFFDDAFNGFQTAVNAIGHQIANSATTDWMNASTFVRLHIDCPTSSGSPIAGTYGINLQQGDGNTFTGGDVEGCSIALHLGANAQNNTIVGLRNENSTSQVVADAGSSYNNWMTGGTMFTGKLTDNGTRNSFLDTFHRSFNGINGDWYGSQQDATVTNHYRLGTGNGNERGLLNRYQTDYGYRWTMGLSDATTGQQFYQVLDELNNVYRLSIGQYNNGQSSTNNQTVINSAGTGAVVLNGSNNAGTGGVVIGSGGANAAAVATINNAGNAQFNGTLQVGGTSTFTGSTTVKNHADAEIDQILWAGATASQKESLTYRDWNGNSQWYMVKDASNNWALNSATGGLDSFKAYQSTNSGDTYINASNATGAVRVNYETGAGTGFKVYGGNSSSVYASFTGTNSIQFPGLAASSGHNCLQIDNSGYVTNTGSACGSGSGGTVATASSGQIAYYTSNGASIGGMSTVPLTAGGTGAATAAGALQNLGGISSTATSQQTIAGPLNANLNGVDAVTVFGAKGDCVGQGSTASCTDNHDAIQAAINAAYASGGAVYFPSNPSATNQTVYYTSQPINPKGVSMYGPPGASGTSDYYPNAEPVGIRGAPGKDVFDVTDPSLSGYVTPQKSFTINDLAIFVDDSANASASYPNRLPGRSVYDAVMTANSAVLTSSTAAFQPGDVGQAVSVAGAGTSGATLISTISAWQSATQVTLAASASTTVSNAHAYVSVFGLSTTQTIGNCAFAYDAKDFTSNGAASGPLKALFSNLVVNVIDNNPANYTCGFFFQGSQSPYQTKWEHSYVGAEFPFAFVSANAVSPSTSQWTGLGDYNTWDHVWINGNYSFLSYDGDYNTMRDIQISDATYGPHILTAYGLEYFQAQSPSSWYIDIPEIESPGSSCTAGEMAFRISGGIHVVNRLGSQYCSSAVLGFQWDASNSSVKSLSLVSIGPLNIAGSGNEINVPWTTNTGFTLKSTGQGNTFITSELANPYVGLQPARKQLAGLNALSVGPPNLSRPALAFARTHDFIDKGAAAYYLNGEDLWLWPYEVGSGSTGPAVVTDATSDTGSALLQAGGTGQFNLSESNGTSWTIGSQFPAGKMRIYVKAKSSVASTWETFWAQANEGGTWTQIGGANFQLTTSYAVYSFDVDTTGLSGDAINIIYGGYGMPANNVYIAWIGVRPWASDMPVGSLQISSGTAMNANHGTGTSVQHSDGTGTSGVCFFAADGSCTSTAGALQNGTTATTQSAGDNSTKIATTAYAASPGAIAPTTVTASGIVTGGNDTTITTPTAIGATNFTTTGLVLPIVPVGTTKNGRCILYWQMSSTSYTATFGIGMSNAPTGLWGGSTVTYSAAGTSNWLAFTQTATAATPISTATAAGAANTTYRAEVDFTLQTGATNPVAVTLYGEVSDASATLTTEPGSACYWLP